MAPLFCSRLCAVMVILALLVGAMATASPGARRCQQCPARCPMHAHRLACHHTTDLPCHPAGGSVGIRSACHHGADSNAPVPAIQGILPAPCAPRPVLVCTAIVERVRALTTQLLPEPPTDPPRVPVLLI